MRKHACCLQALLVSLAGSDAGGDCGLAICCHAAEEFGMMRMRKVQLVVQCRSVFDSFKPRGL